MPPSIDGNDGYHIDIKTQAPPEKYTTYYNERKGTIEKVPAGVHPSFNWNVGRAGRDIPLWNSFMKKGNDGAFHADIEAVAKTILTNRITRAEFAAFINKASSGTIQGSRATAAGFIGRDIAAWLKKNAAIDIGDSVTISLEARLLNGPKAVRHAIAGDAAGRAGAHTIIDALLYGNVYYESESGNLIYLFPHSANNLTKITVNPRLKIEGRTSNIWGPGIVNVQTIPNTPEKGDYRRILIDLQKVK